MRIEINPEHPEPRKIARAVHILREGGCVAYPTDTVYALGCAMSHKKAVDALYDMKRMKREQALALMVPDLSGIAQFAVVHDAQYRFLKHLVPGPYVFILEATREVPKLLMMKRKTIGIRVPEHPVARALVEALGEPLITTTASHPALGPEAMQDPDDIDDRFPQLEMVLDAGFGGLVTSTVIDLMADPPTVQRAGVGMERLEKLYGWRSPVDPEAIE
jgi:tRNA threonylcarbamoyl adenosine modification protein (Sua5/YciO/YrdC/YwlC family)